VISAVDIRVDFPARTGRPLTALDGFDLDVADGEFVSLVGPSGCGKSTALRVLAGLQSPTAGTVHLDSGSRTAWMPQQDALLPWRRAMSNALLGARLAGRLSPEVTAEAHRLFEEFGLGGFERSWPAQLSGGMRQRLALLRTYLTGADILLLDEPFGALDPIRRRRMNNWLSGIWALHPRTAVLVTHDVDEALQLSDRVLVMSDRPGRVAGTFPVDRNDPLHHRQRQEIFALLGTDETHASGV
jgi:ABC-type nitrate/sulfonate/bicarbonate transport system ATPase subunit